MEKAQLPVIPPSDQFGFLPTDDKRYVPAPEVPEIDGHGELKGGSAFAAILKGDVVRHLTLFERKAALINL